MNIVFVTEYKKLWESILTEYEFVCPNEYLLNEKYTSPDFRIINLSKDYSYQSSGYYVSLLAQAREHRVIPSVLTLLDRGNVSVISSLNDQLHESIQKHLKQIKVDTFELSVYFGKNIAQKYSVLAHRLYCEFTHPTFRVTFIRKKNWSIQKIQALTINDIQPSHYDFLKDSAKKYCGTQYFRKSARKKFYYDLAILHNQDEKTPPSNNTALQKFVRAGMNLGLNVMLIEKDDYRLLGEFDALFIRETTAVNHHTYRFSRKAEAEKLFVIDDPESILKCTNKVYIAEYLRAHKIHTPKTDIISKNNYKEYIDSTSYPRVLKKPDGSFSVGMTKVNSADEFKNVAKEYFSESDLLIAQEFLPSEYDWRIGILGDQVLYACRYYMAQDHWQIYNWKDNKGIDGKTDTISLDEVPDIVKKTALRATRYIGRSLYGVDLKLINGNAYVIEINDNPNIDTHIEDLVMGDQIYQTIMQFFLENLNRMHGHVR